MAFLELLKTIGNAIGTLGKPIVVKDTSDNAIFPKALLTGEIRVSSREYLKCIMEGDIPNHTFFSKFISATVPSTTAQLISTEGYTEQTSGAQRSISSSSGNDTSTGTGCKVVKLEFIDGNGDEGYEYVTLNGTTPVNTVSTNIKHINLMRGVSFGTLGVTAGKVSVYTTTGGGGTIFCAISTGDTQSNNALHYVPSGKTLYIVNVNINIDEAGTIIMYKTETSNGYTWLNKFYKIYVTSSVSSPFEALISVPSNGSIKFYSQLLKSNVLVGIELLGWIE